jgi:hypothetical protein
MSEDIQEINRLKLLSNEDLLEEFEWEVLNNKTSFVDDIVLARKEVLKRMEFGELI